MFYPAKIEQVGHRYNISFRDIPEAVTYTDCHEQTLKLAQDALLAAVVEYFKDQRQVSLPSEAQQGEVLITLPASVFAKVLLLNAMIEQNLSNTDLAQRLHLKVQDIQHMLSLEHETEIEQIAQALAVLGKKLALTTI